MRNRIQLRLFTAVLTVMLLLSVSLAAVPVFAQGGELIVIITPSHDNPFFKA